MDNQQPTTGTPIYQESQGKNAKWLWLLIVLIIIGALVFAFVRGIGPFASFSNFGGEETVSSPTPLLRTSPTPTPSEGTPGAELDKSEPVIRVLNGGGTAGAASVMRDILEESGYAVDSVGNADNFDYESTTLRFKEEFKSYSEVLESDLSDDYSVVVSSDDLDDTDDADIEVIVGAK